MKRLNLVVLVSGAGSNLKAIVQAIDEGRCNARVCAVLSDQANAGALEFAASRNIPSEVVTLAKGADRDDWNRKVCAAIQSYNPDLVVLAGFMKLLGASVLAAFAAKIINIHPSLLPSFPGAHAPRDALAAGAKVSGCTVHFVDAGLDSGAILAQVEVPILLGDTEHTLHERIKLQEHQLLPSVIDSIARNTT